MKIENWNWKNWKDSLGSVSKITAHFIFDRKPCITAKYGNMNEIEVEVEAKVKPKWVQVEVEVGEVNWMKMKWIWSEFEVKIIKVSKKY